MSSRLGKGKLWIQKHVCYYTVYFVSVDMDACVLEWAMEQKNKTSKMSSRLEKGKLWIQKHVFYYTVYFVSVDMDEWMLEWAME